MDLQGKRDNLRETWVPGSRPLVLQFHRVINYHGLDTPVTRIPIFSFPGHFSQTSLPIRTWVGECVSSFAFMCSTA